MLLLAPALGALVVLLGVLTLRALAKAHRLQRQLDKQSAEVESNARIVAQERRQRILEACANAVSLEINNPLTSVLGLTRILHSTLKDKGAEPRHLEILDAIETEAQRIRTITRMVLNFVQGRSAASSVDINDVLNVVLDIFEPATNEVFISIVRKLDPTVLKLHASRADLEQGLTHFVNDICIGQVGPADLIVSTGMSGLQRIEIGFEFRHSGLSDAAAKAFISPFGRAQEQQKPGLGFAIAKRVASEHHGEVRAMNDGKSKRYVFVLPATVSSSRPAGTGTG